MKHDADQKKFFFLFTSRVWENVNENLLLWHTKVGFVLKKSSKCPPSKGSHEQKNGAPNQHFTGLREASFISRGRLFGGF